MDATALNQDFLGAIHIDGDASQTKTIELAVNHSSADAGRDTQQGLPGSVSLDAKAAEGDAVSGDEDGRLGRSANDACAGFAHERHAGGWLKRLWAGNATGTEPQNAPLTSLRQSGLQVTPGARRRGVYAPFHVYPPHFDVSRLTALYGFVAASLGGDQQGLHCRCDKGA
ncbi:hypothetical protein [Paucibacter sp. KBW04]|uniref:hypothetical protein n=1 Tax=Paucibacter sp. KBW04 TaxID=2153361 RepID=UPI001E5E5E64|nr:hypothetical protein [Paucibacter sp. KBW04]